MPLEIRSRRLAFLLLLLCFLTVAACGTGAPPPDGQPPGAPEALTPRGAVTAPFSFSWKAVPGGDWVYRVRVTDEAERVLFEHDVRNATTCQPSAELNEMLAERRATFTWSVAIVTPDDRALVRSPAVPFSLK